MNSQKVGQLVAYIVQIVIYNWRFAQAGAGAVP
jgi:hypothetical protein